MKILLIAPYVNLNVDPTIAREDFYPSAALLHLAAMLRMNNYEPIIVDLNNAVVHAQKEKYIDYCNSIIKESLQKHKPDLVGINCLFSGVFPDVLEFAKTVKTYSKELMVCIGGIHPTSYYQEILEKSKYVDCVAIGEGENTIVALASAIKSKNYKAMEKIQAFAFRDKNGEIKVNTEKNYIENLDELPMPAWDLIDFNKFKMDLKTYYNPKKLTIQYKAAIFSSRACPLACNFCDMFLVMGKTHRKRSVKTIVNEIEFLNKEFDVNYFSFMDDQLTLNRGHIIELCDEILKRKLNIQFDTPNGLWINSLRESLIAKMVEAGLVSASLAIEHGDEHIRNKIIGKMLERDKIFEVADILKKYKVMTSALFIMGFPEDTNETLKRTYDMMNELQLDRMAVNTLIPLPGTKLMKQVLKEKLLISNWNLDDIWKTPISLEQGDFVIKPYDMSIDELHEWRETFDNMRHKYWTTNPLKRDTLVMPREDYGKKNAAMYESVIYDK
tara:strand:+ start:228 stop:1724 length:1497 start_codon:yes stop_codon:yes gene_type:complete